MALTKADMTRRRPEVSLLRQATMDRLRDNPSGAVHRLASPPHRGTCGPAGNTPRPQQCSAEWAGIRGRDSSPSQGPWNGTGQVSARKCEAGQSRHLNSSQSDQPKLQSYSQDQIVRAAHLYSVVARKVGSPGEGSGLP